MPSILTIDGSEDSRDVCEFLGVVLKQSRLPSPICAYDQSTHRAERVKRGRGREPRALCSRCTKPQAEAKSEAIPRMMTCAIREQRRIDSIQEKWVGRNLGSSRRTSHELVNLKVW
jgi:hypothetical protein